jgi:tripartite-type tricarboxylate transporter receptor subunit TctC
MNPCTFNPCTLIPGRRFALTVLASALFPATRFAQAQTWPAGKPVKFIIPNSAGSQVDIIARKLSERLSSALATSFVVDNQPGAGGVIGTQNLIRAPKDGYTWSIVSNNHVILPHLNRSLKLDALKDTQPIALIGAGQMVAVTRNNHPAKNLAELLEMARKEPARLVLGHSGNGTILHLAGEQLLRSANVQMLVVSYRGVSPMLPDVIGGQIDLAFAGPASVLSLVKEGKLRALAVTGKEPMTLLPGTPTVAQAGVNGYDMEGWIAMIAPANVPSDIVQLMSDVMSKLLSDPEFEKTVIQSGLSVRPLRGEALRKFFSEEYYRYGRLIEQAGIKLE